MHQLKKVYYNEWNPYAAQWLRNLIASGLIPDGYVDTRSFLEVTASDLRGFTQVHFCAGIGGWPLALARAGWSDDRPVWTASLPCQPFSSSGKKTRQSDERHLSPHFIRLVSECRPTEIIGEQVDDAIAVGWVDDLFDALEAEKYACAATILPACSSGAPHRRDRLFFVANTAGEGSQTGPCAEISQSCAEQRSKRHHGILGNAPGGGWGKTGNDQSGQTPRIAKSGALGHASGNRGAFRLSAQAPGGQGVTNVIDHGSDRRAGHWQECEFVTGPDGKSRPVKPGIPLLVDGISGDLGYCRAEVLPENFKDGEKLAYGVARAERLSGFGNAIEIYTATAFATSYLETQNEILC